MVKQVILALTLVFLCTTTIGCTNEENTSPPTPVVFEQTENGITAQLIIPGNPVPVMQETLLTLTLHDSQGQPVLGASVHHDLVMPGMTMPANNPEVTERENGVYEAPAIFTMAGDWRCRTEVGLADGASLEFTFDVEAQ